MTTDTKVNMALDQMASFIILHMERPVTEVVRAEFDIVLRQYLDSFDEYKELHGEPPPTEATIAIPPDKYTEFDNWLGMMTGQWKKSNKGKRNKILN